jgi:DNA-binding NarL/FixJ family response regulator
MVMAVESVVRGRRFFTPHVAETIAEAYLTNKASPASDSGGQVALTTREREVIQLLAEGKSNKEVATSLNISTRTAEGHRAEIMRRLKLGSLAELVCWAVRNGIVQP